MVPGQERTELVKPSSLIYVDNIIHVYTYCTTSFFIFGDAPIFSYAGPLKRAGNTVNLTLSNSEWKPFTTNPEVVYVQSHALSHSQPYMHMYVLDGESPTQSFICHLYTSNVLPASRCPTLTCIPPFVPHCAPRAPFVPHCAPAAVAERHDAAVCF